MSDTHFEGRFVVGDFDSHRGGRVTTFEWWLLRLPLHRRFIIKLPLATLHSLFGHALVADSLAAQS
jgi:hypothetical protein